jgi:predicted nucleic acid-binding protein
VSVFVDANIFVRLLTGDDPQKAARSLALFQRAQRGEFTLVTSESVVAEVGYVLSSRTTYQIARAAIAAALGPLIADPSLHVEHKESILRSLDLWKDSNLDFTDCLSAEQVRRADLDGIYSYDRDFDRIPGVRRLEP